MARLRLQAKAPDLEALDLRIENAVPVKAGGEVLVEIRAAGVNPSDVKAALGVMPHAVWPRTPGRDWAGIVVDGPDDVLGREVFGSGGDLGITRDGSHANHLAVPLSAICRKPSNLTLQEAGSIGVPFVTAFEGFSRAGLPRPGETILVLGANGKVGQAAIQIATMHGAQVFGAVRNAEGFPGHASGPVRMIDSSREDIASAVRAETNGHGAGIVFNTVGSPYFAAGSAAMALEGRQIFISTKDRAVAFDIFAFYRGRHSFYGVDSLALDATASAKILAQLVPGFESGALRPFAIGETFPLTQAKDAYRLALEGASGRVVLTP